MKTYTFRMLFVFSFCIALISCNDSVTDRKHNPTEEIGLISIPCDIGGAEVYDMFVSHIEENPKTKIVAKIDHSAKAESAEMVLPLTRVIIFGNPELGTPLMKESITTGIDLPQKVLITETVDGYVTISYNDISYLISRHGIEADEHTENIKNAMEALIDEVSSNDSNAVSEQNVEFQQGLVLNKSNHDFETTYARVNQSIRTNENMSIVSELDHQSNAASIGMDMAKSRLIIFGNPQLGSPLMINNQLTGIDLPQKILVYEKDDETMVVYNDPAYLTERFHLEGMEENTTQISNALRNIVQTATQ